MQKKDIYFIMMKNQEGIKAAKGKKQRRDNGCQGKRAVCAAFAAHRIKPFLSL